MYRFKSIEDKYYKSGYNHNSQTVISSTPSGASIYSEDVWIGPQDLPPTVESKPKEKYKCSVRY